MSGARVVVTTRVRKSPRVAQVEGMFDLAPVDRAERAWDVSLLLDARDWHVGLIAGPSGSGKTTVARALFPEAFATAERRPPWPADAAILDGFPEEMAIRDVVSLLTGVGLSSPPAWRRPFATLSTGERFRADLARLLALAPPAAVVDEYAAAVDRTVARVASAALARTVRRRGGRLVAVTCRDDVAAWLRPDWTYRPDTGAFAWGRLRRRPAIDLVIGRCRLDAWRLFRAHHYLSGGLNPAAVAFLAAWEGRPVAFSAWVPALVRYGGRREHRTVTLPDYQGIGIGPALADFAASVWAGLGQRVLSTTSHPGLVAARLRSPHWRLVRAPSLGNAPGRRRADAGHARARLTAGFIYVGPALDRATALGILGGTTARHLRAGRTSPR